MNAFLSPSGSRTVRLLVGLAAAGVVFGLGVVCGSDWPQFRGPDRTGISSETDLAESWPAGGPPAVWIRKDVGGGYGTVAVAGDRFFLISNEGLDNEYVQARSVGNGAQVWSTRIGKVGEPNQRPSYPAARSTPTVEGDRVYALGSDGDLACLSAESGELIWSKQLRADFGGEPGRWAYSESPLVDGDVVVATPGGDQAALVALSKSSGEVVWKAPVPEGGQAAYSSVVTASPSGKKHYVQFLQNGLVGVDAASGQLLWRYDRTAEGSPANIPTPVVAGAYVYSAASRSGGGLVQLSVSADGGVTAEEKYFEKKLPNAIGGSVKLGDYLYGASGVVLQCVNFATGDVVWEERSVAPASVVYADGHLYLYGENGEVALVEATPDGYREKGRFQPEVQSEGGRSKAWAYPVIANGKLYLRDFNVLSCYDIRAN